MTANEDEHILTRRALLGRAAALGIGVLGAGAVGGLRAGGANAAILPVAARGAAAAVPEMVGCDAWGALPPEAPITVLPRPSLRIIIHHTVAPATTADFSLAHASEVARAIQRDHMARPEWIDTGQHLLVSQGGHVLEGRHRTLEALANGRQHVVSAHTFEQNEVAFGIENEGNHSLIDMRDEHYRALVDVCAYICSQYQIRPYAIYGHREFNSTECPGNRLYPRLASLRADVAAVVGGDPTAPVWPRLSQGQASTGERVKTIQYLLRQKGYQIAADGAFGPATDAAVREFQTLCHAAVDGIVGTQTWNQAAVQIYKGMNGEAVRAAQSQLTAHGITTAVDGIFGPGTKASVTRFQTDAGLPADGVVDARTWSRLVA